MRAASSQTAIAATIVYTALENLWIKDASGRWRLTFLFGLIHGFGFAGVLRDLALPTDGFVRALLAFNLGVEAGLGTLGLEVNVLTPEFGPRIYLTGILTELELEADKRITEQVCIGESCSRCLHSCPADAVLHWGISKRDCAALSLCAVAAAVSFPSMTTRSASTALPLPSCKARK